MATTRTFNAMLNEYLSEDLLKEEYVKRDYIFQKVEKDESWKGGTLPVPFRGARASSIKFGGLTGATDIAESSYIRGSISGYREVYASLIFNYRDLVEHDGKMPESTFLRILPDEVEDMMKYYKDVMSIQIGSGPNFATVTDATNAATGILIVDKIDRFEIGQKSSLDDGDSAAVSVYVTAININTKAVTFSLTRGGAAADLSAYSVAQSAKFYHDGVFDAGGNHDTFISLRQALLSAANGGSSTLHGQTKLSYPALQAVNVSGASITASNILDKIFDAYTEVKLRGKGNASTVLMSYKHLGSIMKLLEAQKGPYRVTKDTKVSLYNWTEIEVTSVRGPLTIVGIMEFDDDIIAFIDWSSMKFASNGLFKKIKSPDRLEYHVVRNTTGYQYICDIALYGEMVYKKPGSCGIIHSISY